MYTARELQMNLVKDHTMATRRQVKGSKKARRSKPNAERAAPTISVTVNPFRLDALDYAIQKDSKGNTRSSLITRLMPEGRVAVDTACEYLKFHNIEHGDISDVYEACFLEVLRNDMMGPAVHPSIHMHIAAVCTGDSPIEDKNNLMYLYKKYVRAKLREDGYFFDELKVQVDGVGTFTETIVLGPNDSEDTVQTLKGRIRLKWKTLWQRRSPDVEPEPDEAADQKE